MGNFTQESSPMKAKKHLSFTALTKMISNQVRSWSDPRRQKSTDHSVHDAVMSGLACMYFQEPSLLQFQRSMEEHTHQNNLRTLFGVQNIPSSNTLKDILDDQDARLFNPIGKNIVQRLQRGNQLSQFKLMPGWTVCSIDASKYHSSESIHCKQCLTKQHGDNPVIHQHFALQAALMHPDVKQVIPVMAEPIQNRDGTKKQDCEINAGKRLIPQLRQQFPRMGLIITGDDLFSRQPMIETVLENKFHFFFVAKPTSHTYLMEWLDTYESLHELRDVDDKGRTIIYQWMNDVPLHGGKDAIRVNYFCKKVMTFAPDGTQRSCRTASWVTDLKVSGKNVALFSRGAKTRWKIENECFNTLKNQGYQLTHNYGHGEKHLSFNFYQLTLLAFTLHQIQELCDIAFKACREKAGSKRNLWEKFRTFINEAVFQSWEQLLSYFLNYSAYNIIDGFVVERSPP